MKPVLAALLLAAAAPGARAQAQATWHGYLDLRVAMPADAEDWNDGGLGKVRFGGGEAANVAPSAALAGDIQLAPELLASAQLQYLPDQRRPLDLLEAWVRYRPVSTTPWRWSLRAGVKLSARYATLLPKAGVGSVWIEDDLGESIDVVEPLTPETRAKVHRA